MYEAAPLIGFKKFGERSHTGKVLAKEKVSTLEPWGLDPKKSISRWTEDGASSNKKSNKILDVESGTCGNHDLHRAVVTALGFTGGKKAGSKNADCKAFVMKTSTMSASFHRSVDHNMRLQEKQTELYGDEFKVKQTHTQNHTRWTGVHKMSSKVPPTHPPPHTTPRPDPEPARSNEPAVSVQKPETKSKL